MHCKSSFFYPLGLDKTYVAQQINNEIVPGFCRYLNSPRLMENVVHKYHPGWCATGLIVSTTNDVVHCYEAIFNDKLIDTEQLNNMCELVVPTGQERSAFFGKPCYGLGVMLDPESMHGNKIGHGGDGPSYNTWVMHLPSFNSRKLTIAAFCNTSMGMHPFPLVNDLLYILGNAS